MTKKRSSEISVDENQEIFKFFGKSKIFKIFVRVRQFFENRGKSETGMENASWSQGGMDAPGWV